MRFKQEVHSPVNITFKRNTPTESEHTIGFRFIPRQEIGVANDRKHIQCTLQVTVFDTKNCMFFIDVEYKLHGELEQEIRTDTDIAAARELAYTVLYPNIKKMLTTMLSDAGIDFETINKLLPPVEA